MKVYELLDEPRKWTKIKFARDREGQPTDPKSNRAVCWCFLGAIVKCYPGIEVRNTIMEKTWNYLKRDIDVWNDHRDTTYEDVIRVAKELNI